MFCGFPRVVAAKAIRLLSGDQRGKKTCMGGKVSWTGWLPSTLLRHKLPSGKVTYETHSPSVSRKVQPFYRQARKIGHDLLGLGVQTRQFAAWLRTDYEESLAIYTRNGRIVVQRTGSQLYRLGRYLTGLTRLLSVSHQLGSL